MENAIVHFEDHESVARNFYTQHLLSKLVPGPDLAKTTWKWQMYLNLQSVAASPFDPSLVAKQAYTFWSSLNIEKTGNGKTVWIIDLDADGSTTPDRSYGLCVLNELCKEFGSDTKSFLDKDSFLTVFFTLYSGAFTPDSMYADEFVAKLPPTRHNINLTQLGVFWPSIRKIKGSNPTLGVAEAVQMVRGAGPRLVLANRGVEDEWLACVIAKWLKG